MEDIRLEKLENLTKSGIAAYGDKFIRSHTVSEILADFKEGTDVQIAGRLMSNRSHGKVFFADLQDVTGKIQLFVKMDNENPDLVTISKLLDLGDMIGVKGTLFVTKTGQNSVRVAKLTMIAKSLHSLPEKWHGLKDVEIRYRQRYVDLIVNKEVREVFIKRSKIISYIRRYLDQKDFLEVETPMLQPMAGGARGRPFKSHHNAYDMDVFLRIAPELYLKRLLVGGFEKIYEINRNFRNEGVSTRHNPEFTMLELYQAYGNYEDMMNLTEEMVSSLVQEMTGSYKMTYQGKEIDFTPPWERRSFAKVVKEKLNIDPEDSAGVMLEKLKKRKGAHVKIDKMTRSAVMKIVEDLLEEDKIINPVFFTEYFTFLCPLAKTIPTQPALSQRFEAFIGGLEVGNAYSELNDPLEQKKRLLEDLEDDVETGNRNIDEDFLNALAYGMPSAGGLGIGVDRLVMLLTDSPSIRDVILFPLLKPEQNSQKS